ncbi:MAG: thermonuclease family protein, partial [Silicimonas sp.]|nr:thermonuclease family protein [Silicimonas sp.]
MMKMAFGACIALAVASAAFAQTRVIDGDTLEIAGTIYRLNGVDAPEHGQKCGDWNCGSAATEALVEITKGRDVTCDALSEDGYGRVIATC